MVVETVQQTVAYDEVGQVDLAHLRAAFLHYFGMESGESVVGAKGNHSVGRLREGVQYIFLGGQAVAVDM